MAELVTPALVRGARGMLDWSMVDLSNAARVSVSTVKRAESTGSGVVSPAILEQIQRAFEGVGMVFLPDEGEGPGLKLQPRAASPIARFF